MKPAKSMIFSFLAPAVIAYIFLFIYPTFQTFFLSFTDATQLAGGEMHFQGLTNYIELYRSPLFRQTFVNIALVWAVGGLAIFGLSFLFTVLLTSGIKGKSFFRAVIYLPNLIPATAA